MPICIHTICFKEWGRECAMHFRPRSVVWIVYAFRLVDYVWNGWFRLGKLHINGYLVCVGLRRKIWWRLVGAVPVCPPVSPCKGAFIVKFPAYNACIFCYGNAAARTFGRAHRRRPYGSFGWIAFGWFCLLVGKTVHMNQHHRCCTFDSAGLIERSEIYPG